MPAERCPEPPGSGLRDRARPSRLWDARENVVRHCPDAQTGRLRTHGCGLRLRIGARRSTWVLICKIGRHPSRHTLGHFPAMTRAEARAEALRMKAALASGADPAVRALRNAQAFGDVCEDYFRDIKRRGLRSARETERDTRRDLRAWWHRPVDRLERADILRLVRDVTDNRSPAAAHHAFSYCSRILNWCVEQGLIEHSPCYGLRPSRLIGEKQPGRAFSMTTSCEHCGLLRGRSGRRACSSRCYF